jgi:hypothetical protein
VDFLLYLTPIGRNIVSNVMLKNYKVLENAPICKKHKELFGYTRSPNFIICLDNIKNTISPVNHYVNETVYHEAVHIAQSCKQGPLGVVDPNLSAEKLNDVKRSVKYNSGAFVYEVEAYYLEDKPELVNYYLKKFCF